MIDDYVLGRQDPKLLVKIINYQSSIINKKSPAANPFTAGHKDMFVFSAYFG